MQLIWKEVICSLQSTFWLMRTCVQLVAGRAALLGFQRPLRPPRHTHPLRHIRQSLSETARQIDCCSHVQLRAPLWTLAAFWLHLLSLFTAQRTHMHSQPSCNSTHVLRHLYALAGLRHAEWEGQIGSLRLTSHWHWPLLLLLAPGAR